MPTMKVMIACEFSGIVRDAFTEYGHDAVSCDLIASERPKGNHIIGDIMDADLSEYDLLIAHPPCTYLAILGARWFDAPGRRELQKQAIEFVISLYNAPVDKIAIENPVGVLSTHWRKPDQYIQPWQFGHGVTKKTGLWLKNLPKLTPTDIVEGRKNSIHMMSNTPDRWKNRSRTFVGFADAMATQWGSL